MVSTVTPFCHSTGLLELLPSAMHSDNGPVAEIG